MKIVNLSETNSVLHQFIKEIRSVDIQNDKMRFRRNMERIGEIMSYEISKSLNFQIETIKTPLGSTDINVINDNIVISTIFRAGLPYHQGFMSYFDNAENAFVSAYRKYKDKINFEIYIEYIASPDLNGKTLIVTDPMLATGSSMELAFKALLTKGKPSVVHFAAVIASQPSLDYLTKVFGDTNITIWVGAVDPILNDHAYIVPGLGDAGDLAFGPKI